VGGGECLRSLNESFSLAEKARPTYVCRISDPECVSVTSALWRGVSCCSSAGDIIIHYAMVCVPLVRSNSAKAFVARFTCLNNTSTAEFTLIPGYCLTLRPSSINTNNSHSHGGAQRSVVCRSRNHFPFLVRLDSNTNRRAK
jgi:hypothetical protein